MSPRRRAARSGLAVVLSLMLIALAARPARSQDSSMRWRPDNDLGAVGTDFEISVRALPTELLAEDPLTLTVRITARGPWRRPPRRPALERLPSFAKFVVAPSTSERADREMAAPRAWEFDYRIRPRSAEVDQIPRLSLAYDNPTIPLEENRWQTIESSPIPLKVQARPALRVDAIQNATGPAPWPDFLADFSTGLSLLRHEEAAEIPSLPVLIVFLALPPLGIVTWELTRRWARGRLLSPAARRALSAIRKAGGAPADERAAVAALALGDYLQQTIGLTAAEQTPTDIASRLEQAGCPTRGVAEVVAFFEAWDAFRFAAPGGTADDLPEGARRAVYLLEAEACSRADC